MNRVLLAGRVGTLHTTSQCRCFALNGRFSSGLFAIVQSVVAQREAGVRDVPRGLRLRVVPRSRLFSPLRVLSDLLAAREPSHPPHTSYLRQWAAGQELASSYARDACAFRFGAASVHDERRIADFSAVDVVVTPLSLRSEVKVLRPRPVAFLPHLPWRNGAGAWSPARASRNRG